MSSNLTIVGKKSTSYSKWGRVALHTFLIIVAIATMMKIGRAHV